MRERGFVLIFFLIFCSLFIIFGSIIILQKIDSAKLPLVTTPLEVKSANVTKLSMISGLDILSEDTIFQYFDPELDAKNENPDEYVLIATGDVILARSVNNRVVRMNNFKYPFEETVDFLKNADAVFINLESPLIPNCPLTDTGMKFCGDQRNVAGLVYGGVNAVSIANNHMGNYGIYGIDSTVDLLKKNNINVTGNGQPAIIIIRDKKFGFLGYNDIGGKESGIAWADIPQVQQEIQDLKKQVDFVITTFHWGVEYTASPSVRQTELAHAAIDAGADLIIGNHPHWVQGVEQYKDKFITYAHGNFIFDQMWSRETQEGVLGRYTFNNEGLVEVKFFPVIIEDYSKARFATEEEADKILSRMKEASIWK